MLLKKRKTICIGTFCLVFVLVFCFRGSSEIITLKNGRVIEGRVIEETDKTFVVDIEVGRISLSREEIKMIQRVDDGHDANNREAVKKETVEENAEKEISGNETANETAETDAVTEVFLERFTDFIKKMREYQENPSLAEQDKAEKAMLKIQQFSKEYPDSELVDDIDFLVTMIGFLGVLPHGNMARLSEYISHMEAFVKRNPGGKMENISYNKLMELLELREGEGYDSLRIPYPFILHYMRGMAAVQFKDWEIVVDEYIVLRNELPYGKEYRGAFIFDIYPYLTRAYVGLEEFRKAEMIAEEALYKFPDSEWLERFMEDIRQKIKESK